MALELRDIVDSNLKGNFYHLVIDGLANCRITQSPLHDCQIYTVGNMAYILGKENPLELLKFIRSRINKAQMLFNIKQDYMKKVRDIIPANMIVIEEPYTSTNNSEMCMYLVKTEFLK